VSLAPNPHRHDDLIAKLADAVSEALDFFVARDEMDAKVHLAPARLSPITEHCRDALEAWREYRYPPLVSDGSAATPGPVDDHV
jgi:hypothetical protein